MNIPQLISLISEFTHNDDLGEKEKKSMAINIKRQYNILIQTKKSNGHNITLQDLRKLFSPLIENYSKVQQYQPINEVLQLMAEEIKDSDITTKKDQDNVENEIAGIYTKVLGNPGSSTKGMSSEYISKIVAKKIADAGGINRDDILDLLIMQSKNMYMDIEQYKNLINDSVITYLTTDSKYSTFENPKILQIFESLASTYKISEDYDKVKEIYQQALGITSLKDTPEYKDLNDNYNNFLEYMEMKEDFEDRRFDSFDNLIGSLNTTFLQEGIFTPGTNTPSPRLPSPRPPHINYIMPVSKKLDGFKRLLTSLKNVNPNYDILECSVGKDSYQGYVIFKIENANVSILENFNDVNARIYIVKNEMIDQVKKITKNEAVALDGVEAANHIENFENYCKHITTKTLKLIKETGSNIKTLSDPETSISKESLVEPNTSINSKDEMNVEAQSPIENSSSDTVFFNEDSKETEFDKVELERKKALEYRKRLKELEQELENIKKSEKDKIAGIIGNDEQQLS